jgi:hypothetical protein
MVFEGAPNFAGLFSNIASVQFGVIVPTALQNDPATYNFDLSSVEIVPEAGGLGALALAACAALGVLRSRKGA